MSKIIELDKTQVEKLKEDTAVLQKRNNWFATSISKILALGVSQKARLGNLSVLLAVRFITAGLGFVTTVKIANVLGKAGYGEFAYALALGTYGAAIVQYGLNRTLIRDLVHNQQDFDIIVFGSIILRIIMLIVVVAGLFIWKAFGDPNGILSTAIICIVMLKSILPFDLNSVYDSWYQFKRHAIYSLAERCIYFACIWIAVITAPKMLGLWWIAGAMAISTAIYLLIQYQWAFTRIRSCWDLTLIVETIVRLFKQNMTIWIASIAILSFGSFNQIILRHLKGAQEVGGYAVAWQLVVVANMFVQNISRIGNPATARITRSGISSIARRNFMAKYIGVMIIASLPVSLLAIVCPMFILGALFRPEYLSAAPIMRIMGIYLLFLSTGIALEQYVISARMDKIYLASVITGSFLSIFLNFLLIPRWAGLGAAIALLLGYCVSMGMYYVATMMHINRGK